MLSREAVEHIIEQVVLIIELAGVGVIVVGALIALFILLKNFFTKSSHPTSLYTKFRRGLGRAILLGLEFLVAADIIRTVVVDLTLPSIGGLALLVVIRTFLSFSIELEIYGRFPWQHHNEDSSQDA